MKRDVWKKKQPSSIGRIHLVPNQDPINIGNIHLNIFAIFAKLIADQVVFKHIYIGFPYLCFALRSINNNFSTWNSGPFDRLTNKEGL